MFCAATSPLKFGSYGPPAKKFLPRLGGAGDVRLGKPGVPYFTAVNIVPVPRVHPGTFTTPPVPPGAASAVPLCRRFGDVAADESGAVAPLQIIAAPTAANNAVTLVYRIEASLHPSSRRSRRAVRLTLTVCASKSQLSANLTRA